MRQARLLDQYKPERYQLTIGFDKPKKSFTGTVEIYGTVVSEQNFIDLHSVGLTIISAKINGIETSVESIAAEQKIRLSGNQEYGAGSNATINIRFSSEITETMEGIYPSDYTENEVQKRLISTQFESHHAREAFPCIDEPSAKAVFELTLETPDDGCVVLGNTPIKKQSTISDKVITCFEPSPKMSSYLLAFVIGDLESKTATTKRGVEVRTFAQPSHIESTIFPLKTAVKVLDFFEEYFEIEYPLEKCDLVAIPQFAAGAMENWGLVTFRESALLVDKYHSSLSNKQWVALVVAHELAHQWFGNLVTMQWWDDLWLNEGFASWVEYLAVAELYPEWEMWTQYVADDYLYALRADSLASSHPIEVEVDDPRDISEIFDHITYRKGSAVIRQLHNHMGAENFQKGLIRYLRQHSYGNATTQDLWDSLSRSCDIDVAAFMSAWTTQTGYPVVSFEDVTNTASQQKFLIDPSKKSDDTIWPVVLQPENNNGESIVIKQKNEKIEQNISLPLNPGRNGLYRVNYTDDQYEKLSKLKLTTEDIMGQLNDGFELAKAGYSELATALKLLPAYKDTANSAIWDIMATQLGDMTLALGSDEMKQAKKPFLKNLVLEQYRRLGWIEKDNESHHDTVLRPTIVALAVHSSIDDATTHAEKYMIDYLSSQISIPADIRSTVYHHFTEQENQKAFDKLLKLHNETQLAEEKSRLTAALCSFEAPELYQQAIDLIRSDAVQLQDVISWLAGLLRNRHSRDAAWQWYKNNWSWIEDMFAGGHLYNYFPQVLGVFSDNNKIKEIRSFFEDKNTNGIAMSLEQALEKISWQSALRNREYEAVLGFFETS
ncbi:M1 family metallopeptidase [Candidatus Saccharibacteria bacterium]|jgi:aminopeptidase N|nr:M1 family metallopeptidase [Candidatus Saccharibacteria bacterium]